MKVAIVTIHDNTNYGNRLQNYALQETLKNFGCEVESLVKSKPLKDDGSLRAKRKQVFFNFEKKYLNIREYAYLKDIQTEFDYFVVGSDQIWNPYVRLSNKFKFLTFAPCEKRIAYAPSFGLSKIPFIFYPIYKKGIKNMNVLSIRENAGKEIVKKIVGERKICPVLVDPTMLLTKKEWENFSLSSMQKGNYICTYFLGRKSKYEKFINEIARENNYHILRLNDQSNSELYSKSPVEFVNIIMNSKLVCTDSFHGCVFSIILERPFIVFDRDDIQKNANSRIDTLLMMTEMTERKYQNINKQGIFDINFDTARINIKKEREKSLKYLRNALNIEDFKVE